MWAIRARFEGYTTVAVIGVRFDPNSNDYGRASLYDYFQKELKSKSENELIIIYYYGDAGMKGKSYSW